MVAVSEKLDEKLIIPTDCNLSLTEIGILGMILNCVELDYCSREDFFKASPAENKRTIDKALSELCKKGYLIKLKDNRFAFNKHKFAALKLIER